MSYRALLGLLVAGSLTACGAAEPCEGGTCDCPALRELPGGGCCSTLRGPSSAADTAVCTERRWALPNPADAIGDPGADRLSVAVDARGQGIVTWVAVTGEQLESAVVVAEEQSSWVLHDAGQMLDGFGTRPSLAVGPTGEALLSWKQELVEQSFIHHAFRDAESSWQWPRPEDPLSLAPQSNQPFSHIAPSGEAFVLFNQFDDDKVFGVAIATRPPDGVEFSRPTAGNDVISPAINFSNAPRIATADNGDALVTWYQAPEPQSDLVVYASRRQGADAPFPAPQLGSFISPEGGTIDGSIERNPVPFLGPRGQGGVVWSQRTADGRLAAFFAAMDGRGVWTPPSDGEDTFSPPGGDVADVIAVMTMRAEVLVVWTQDATAPRAVFSAHRDSSGEFDVPGTEPEQLSGAGALAIDPTLAAGPDGEAVVAWSEQVGDRWQVVARTRPPEATDWSVPVVLSDPGADATAPDAAIGAGGRILVGWLDGPPGRARAQIASL